ncbi:hypothetical protein ACP4J3_24595 [Streptomyces sp. UG1]
MSENPQIAVVLEYVETRERELADQVAHLRVRIEELAAQLGELDAKCENLRVTHKTLLALPAPAPAEDPDRPAMPDHLAYQQILAAFTARAADAGPRPVPGARPADRPEEHRGHPLQAEAPGRQRHPHRTGTRPVRPARHLNGTAPRWPAASLKLNHEKDNYSRSALSKLGSFVTTKLPSE